MKENEHVKICALLFIDKRSNTSSVKESNLQILKPFANLCSSMRENKYTFEHVYRISYSNRRSRSVVVGISSKELGLDPLRRWKCLILFQNDKERDGVWQDLGKTILYRSLNPFHYYWVLKARETFLAGNICKFLRIFFLPSQ